MMTKKTELAIGALIGLLIGLPMSYWADDRRSELDVARDIEQAQRDAQNVARFNRIAQQMCGQNTVAQLNQDGSILCIPKKGKPVTVHWGETK